MSYQFDDPATESNAQPDWADIVEIPSGAFEARLTKAEIRADNDKGNLAVLTEWSVQLPDVQDPVEHTNWFTTHRKRQANWATAQSYEMIGNIIDLPAAQVKNAMIQSRYHDKMNELLASKVGNVYRLTFVRKDGSQYVNVTKVENI